MPHHLDIETGVGLAAAIAAGDFIRGALGHLCLSGLARALLAACGQ